VAWLVVASLSACPPADAKPFRPTSDPGSSYRL
jgi:hypothetical protein